MGAIRVEFQNNTGKAQKIKIEDDRTIGGAIKACHWITVKPGHFIDLEKGYGIALGLTLIESETSETPLDTNPEDSKDDLKIEKVNDNAKFIADLQNIKGIGKKTALDIVKIFPDEKSLKNAIKKGLDLPFRDDVSEALKKKWRK